jgi:hypothetical protein
MNEPNDHAVQRAWQGRAGDAAIARIQEVIRRSLQERRRRSRAFWISAAIIVPGWVATLWLFPDLRAVAAAGLAVSAWLAWQMHRRNSTATPRTVHVSCLAFEIAELSRERNFHRSMPRWFLSAVIAGQVVIVAALVTNPRFEKDAMFMGSLTAFVMTVIAVLTFAYRRSRRIAADLDREITLLRKGVEA